MGMAVDSSGQHHPTLSPLELQTKITRSFTLMEKASTRAFSWLKAATTYFGLPPI